MHEFHVPYFLYHYPYLYEYAVHILPYIVAGIIEGKNIYITGYDLGLVMRKPFFRVWEVSLNAACSATDTRYLKIQ